MESKKKRKIWPWILLAVLAVLLIAAIRYIGKTRADSESAAYETYTVARGSVSSTITGSGKLESAGTEDIDVPDGVIVSEVLVEAGDGVRTGDTLATLDADSLKDRAASLSAQLSTLDAELLRMSGSKTAETVYAPAKGRIKYLPVSEGSDVVESVAKYGSLALISTDGLMQVQVPSEQELAVSSEVTVKWQDGSDSGAVAEKTADGYLITLDDDKAPYGETAQVYSGETLIGEGTLAIHAPVAVFANGGTIGDVRCELDDSVSAGSKLFTLENGPYTADYQQKFSERTDVAGQLESVLAYLDDPKITAKSDGVVSAVNVAEGEEPGSASASAQSSSASVSSVYGSASSSSSTASAASSGESAAFVVDTGGALKMTISVDELDICSVTLGQEASVTLDAISSEKFTATVTRISGLGSADGSITTFPVELTLSPDARFLSGMSGNATILVDEADDALIIPIEAISEDSDGAFVYVGNDLVKTYITTGLSDGEYAEVKSGLSEGDVISYVAEDSDSTTLSTAQGPFSRINRGGTTDGN